jgi:hypothetical protein
MNPLTLSARYRRDLTLALARQARAPQRAIDERDLSLLPPPVQRYVQATGLLGMSHASNARLVWREMALRGSPDAAWMRMECEQISFFRRPTRLAMMRTSLAHVLLFEGYDSYIEGRGEMRIQLARVLPVSRSRGPHMDASALVTFLSEGMLFPSLWLESPLFWTPLDAERARAELRYPGGRVGGVFHFDRAGEHVRFETEDRWRDGPVPVRQRWSAHASDFAEHKGLRLPQRARALWHTGATSFEYMNGVIDSVCLDVEDSRMLAQRPPRARVAARIPWSGSEHE